MKAFRILSLAATLALPTSLVAETKSSKLNPEPSKTMTPAKVNEKKHPVSSSVDGHDAVEALSPKNKKVFSTLSPDDQKRVDDAYKRGKDPQAKMMDILKHDHKSNMKKSKKSKSKSKSKSSTDGFIWESPKTPAQSHADKTPSSGGAPQKTKY